jgi:hypothetical protein
MPEKIKLYRVENPNLPVKPGTQIEGGTSHPDIQGQWFSDDPDKALNYLAEATQYKPTSHSPFEAADGAVLHIAEVDIYELEAFRAANHPIVIKQDMDYEPDEDYIIPADKIISSLALDDLVGESRGKMNNLLERRKAIDRVRGAVALHLDK